MTDYSNTTQLQNFVHRELVPVISVSRNNLTSDFTHYYC